MQGWNSRPYCRKRQPFLNKNQQNSPPMNSAGEFFAYKILKMLSPFVFTVHLYIKSSKMMALLCASPSFIRAIFIFANSER